MEVLPSNFTYSDNDRLNLERLLDMFGSVVSLENIASAYCQAGRDFHTASDMLCDLQGSRSEASELISGNELEDVTRGSSSSDDVQEKALLKSKPKRISASVGTVSGVIGREYGWLRPVTKESCKVTKPLKLSAIDFPASEIWDEKDTVETKGKRETMHHDVAEFLYKMLGVGFRLNMEIIQDVAGQCGYDVKKVSTSSLDTELKHHSYIGSMEKLLDLSASAFRNGEDISNKYCEKSMTENVDLTIAQCQEKSCSRSNSVVPNGAKSTSRKDSSDLPKEILEALFNGPDRTAEEPRKNDEMKRVRRSRAFGQVVEGPPKELHIETPTIVTRLRVIEETLDDKETEDDFEHHKRAAKEYSKTMMEYYRAAVEAYTAEDQERADKLLEEGQFFMEKAREADEKAAQILIQTRDDEEQVSIDLSHFEPRSAVRHLKVQLTNLCGFPSIRYLKLMVGDKDKDPKGRRKRLIIKLLEKERLPHKEEENGQAIVIPAADINPKRLSFTNK